MKGTVVLLSALVLIPAATCRADGAPAPKPCEAAEHHQFDFWIGDWSVTTPDGKPAGTNRIDAVLNGCALHESWHGAGGGHGESLNAFSVQDGSWHQTWVDDHGGVLLLSGAFQDGRMVLESRSLPSRKSPGKSVKNRITWSRLDGGRVRQLWEASEDEGKSWKVQFDGTYAKKP